MWSWINCINGVMQLHGLFLVCMFVFLCVLVVRTYIFMFCTTRCCSIISVSSLLCPLLMHFTIPSVHALCVIILDHLPYCVCQYIRRSLDVQTCTCIAFCTCMLEITSPYNSIAAYVGTKAWHLTFQCGMAGLIIMILAGSSHSLIIQVLFILSPVPFLSLFSTLLLPSHSVYIIV